MESVRQKEKDDSSKNESAYRTSTLKVIGFNGNNLYILMIFGIYGAGKVVKRYV